MALAPAVWDGQEFSVKQVGGNARIYGFEHASLMAVEYISLCFVCWKNISYHKYNPTTLQKLTVAIQALHKMATGSYPAQHLVLK